MTKDQDHDRSGDDPQAKATGREQNSCVTSGEYWRWCPRCGGELQNHKCKLTCPRCHYFMSCSDFD